MLKDLELQNGSYVFGNIISDEFIEHENEKIRVIISVDYLYSNIDEAKTIRTTVVLKDNITGRTRNKINDIYDRDTGIDVAYVKAKNKQDLKQIKILKNNIENRLKTIRPFDLCTKKIMRSIISNLIK